MSIEELIEVVSKEQEDNKYERLKGTTVSNDDDAALRVYYMYPHWVCCEDTLFVFDKETGLWEHNQTAYRSAIRNLQEYLWVEPNKTSKTESFDEQELKKSYGNTLALIDKIPPMIKTLCQNNNWLKEAQYSSLGKILFLNGYYDFKVSKFYSKSEYGFNPDIVFMGRIHHNYEGYTTEDLEYMDDIKTRLIYNTLGKEVGDYLLINLARALAGDGYKMKRILFGLGPSNTGKGVLTTALTLSCGDYIGSFNAENLAHRNTGQDEGQIMRWALLVRFCRIIISNEIKSHVELNGVMINKIASGGDSLIGRSHGGNETPFITHFLPIVLANDLPKINPYNDSQDTRVRVINYNKEYVDEPKNDFELKKDDNIKEEIRTHHFQKCFVGLLIRFYDVYKQNGDMEPSEVKVAKNMWVSQEKSIIDTFKQNFEFTNDPNHYTISKDIEEWMKQERLMITMKKLGIELAKYCAIHKLDKIESKPKKLRGVLKQVWLGIRAIEEDLTPTVDE
jgi:hypothetical protein